MKRQDLLNICKFFSRALIMHSTKGMIGNSMHSPGLYPKLKEFIAIYLNMIQCVTSQSNEQRTRE